MANRQIRAGDYFLTHEKQLFRIVDVYTDTSGTYYDLRSCSKPKPIMQEDGDVDWARNIRGVPRNEFRHMGKVIPEEKITKAMKILYK